MDEGKIDVSVIVAIYNIEKYLRACLESLKIQDYDSCEFILVNDGSTDSCGEICDEYAQKDGRFKVVHKKNGGSVSARRTGLDNAKGNYIYFIDGDDWMDGGLLSEIMKKQKEYNSDLLVFSYYRSYELEEQRADNSYVGLVKDAELDSLKKIYISKGKLYHFGITPALWNKLWERELVQKLYMKIPNNISIGEDFALTVPYIMECQSILFVNTKHAYHYRIRNDSMTHKYDSMLIDKVRDLKVYFNTLKFPPEITMQMDRYWAMIATMLIDNQMSGSANSVEKRSNVMKIYDIPGFLEAISRIPQKDYTLRFKMLLYPFINKDYRMLTIMHHCDIFIRKIFRLLAMVRRRAKKIISKTERGIK